MRAFYLVCGALLLLWFVAGWFLATALHLQQSERWILRIGFWLIGLIAAALVVWYYRSRSATVPTAQSPIADDLRFVLQEAGQRLRRSRTKGSGRSIASMPLVLFIGDTGTAKTTVIENSGLDLELLSGNARQLAPPPPTTSANLWLSGGTVMAELGGNASDDESALATAIRMFGPRSWRNWIGLSTHAPRAVVLCVDAGLLKPREAATALAAVARRYHQILGRLSEAWGTALPVYVLFTRTDQLDFFLDYVGRFTMPEGTEPFGFTFPFEQADAQAGHNDRQNERVGVAFDQIFLRAAAWRLDLLQREEDVTRRPGVYQFPREFRKLSDLARQFLVDVSRPSLLRTSPYLRGFYYTGVRPVIAQDTSASSPTNLDLAATGVFNQPGSSSATGAGPQRKQKRFPHWVFLKGFYTEVLFRDKVSHAASRTDSRAFIARRFLLATAAVSALVFTIGATVSWWSHRALLEPAANAARSLAAAPPSDSSVDRWRELEQLRAAASQVTEYHRNGPPAGMRWGLYRGEPMYQNVRSAWCRAFNRLALAELREAMQGEMSRLPATAEPAADYDRTFNLLRAYLMLTSMSARTDAAFLEGTLQARYDQSKNLTGEAADLASRQFAFLGKEQASGICATSGDDDAVAQARAYLWSFQPLERIYGNIVRELSPKSAGYRFTDPSGAVSAPYSIPSVYTAAAYASVDRAIQHAPEYLNREPWVLGPPPQQALIAQDLREQLKTRFVQDYIAHWTKLLESASVIGYASLKDAVPKLASLSGTESPLLRLFCEISINTAVPAPAIVEVFQPFHTLETPAGCSGKLTDAPTEEYMMALARIRFQVEELGKQPDTVEVALDSVNAKVAAQNTARKSNLPVKAADLLLAPIVWAERLETRRLPDSLNGSGADFCKSAQVFRKFPFSLTSPSKATVDEVRQVFQPDSGTLWKFYESALQSILVPSGTGYIAKPGAKIKVNPEFLAFINRASALGRTLFGKGELALPYTVAAKPSPGVSSFTLDISGKVLNGSENGGDVQQYTWTGASDNVKLAPKLTSGNVPEPLTISGPWAVWELLAQGPHVMGTISAIPVSPGATGRVQTGTAATVNLSAEVGGRPILALFPSRCVSKVVQ